MAWGGMRMTMVKHMCAHMRTRIRGFLHENGVTYDWAAPCRSVVPVS